MTLSTDKSILYILSVYAIYTINTITPTTPTLFGQTAIVQNPSCVRFFNDVLYVNSYGNNKLYTLDSSGNIINNFIHTKTTSGTAFISNGDWYVSNQIQSSAYSIVNNNGILTDISTNGITANNTDFNVIAFDGDDNAYYLTWNIIPGIYKSTSAFCFNEGSKILCMNNQLKDEYIAIELLQIGDFVKTYKHGYRRVSKVITGSFRNNPKKWNMCMYKMAKTPTNGLIEDLIVTGGHSILVDAISDEEQKKYDEMGIPSFSKLTIDNKHLLLSCCSDQFTPMQDTSRYNYYHLLLENNNDEEEQFGIWANGILTETPNEKTVK
jgi:hypothetical protein